MKNSIIGIYFIPFFIMLLISSVFVTTSSTAEATILKNPPPGSQIWNNNGDGYSSSSDGNNYFVGPEYPSLNGYSGKSFAVSNGGNGEYYVQLNSGGWVKAQDYSPAMDNPIPAPPSPQPAGGSEEGNNSSEPIAATLCLISKSLQGPIGKAVATIAIVVLGIGLFLGKLSWPIAVATAIGVGLIFGSSEMVSWLSKSSGGC